MAPVPEDPRAGIDMVTAKKRNKWWSEDVGSSTM
jgi:hypothetical protein